MKLSRPADISDPVTPEKLESVFGLLREALQNGQIDEHNFLIDEDKGSLVAYIQNILDMPTSGKLFEGHISDMTTGTYSADNLFQRYVAMSKLLNTTERIIRSVDYKVHYTTTDVAISFFPHRSKEYFEKLEDYTLNLGREFTFTNTITVEIPKGYKYVRHNVHGAIRNEDPEIGFVMYVNVSKNNMLDIMIDVTYEDGYSLPNDGYVTADGVIELIYERVL